MDFPGSPEKEIARICLEKKWRIAVAESCTGGLLGGRITAVPGSSSYFLGGVVAYSNSLKVSLLHVDPDLIQQHGAVSGDVARAMAKGIAAAATAEIGVAVTGVAGPEGSEEKPPGTVFIAVCTPLVSLSRHYHFSGDRAAVREAAVREALALVVECAGTDRP
ncbi:MAG: CinA family protein [bacterium]|nr:MAG: CinA family protein [bacterium]